MKKFKFIVAMFVLCAMLVVSLVSFASCSKGQDGNWDPIKLQVQNAQLSENDEIHIRPNIETVTFTLRSTNYSSMWVCNFNLDGADIQLPQWSSGQKNCEVTGEWGKISYSYTSEVTVTLESNTTTSPRTIILSLESGDAFRTVKIIQDSSYYIN